MTEFTVKTGIQPCKQYKISMDHIKKSFIYWMESKNDSYLNVNQGVLEVFFISERTGLDGVFEPDEYQVVYNELEHVKLQFFASKCIKNNS